QPVQTPPEASAWVTTPMIQAAERAGDGLILRGVTAPSGRVVVRASGGVAYATSADNQGRFVLRIGAPAADTLFVVETQNGQEAAPAPYRLLMTRDPGGPIALLTPGGPSLRLDGAGPLDVIDSDGRALLASGRVAPGGTVALAMDDGVERSLGAGPDGRWVAPMARASSVTVGGHRYESPAPGGGAASAPLSVTATSGGNLVVWTTTRGAAQSSWFPNRL
ncbi:MAG: hypothetical protein JWR59_84, partial [Brevundimonas sp.]|nr:hypothetical protein [Brevundimonas sp.]